MSLKAPFPWFGGKSRVAPIVWYYFGDVDNYVEPFAGSLAVLLDRPHQPQTETVNDIDCFLANFWRALAKSPKKLAAAADWPVNEADLHARHLWLVNNEEFRERMKTDPEYFDVRVAGWWVWGISQWIGSGWCQKPEWTGRSGAGIFSAGVAGKRPHLSGRGTGIGIHGDKASSALEEYMFALSARLRRVRVCCGDWTRVLGPSVTVKHGVCGVFLDPPYDMRVVSDKRSGRDGNAPSDGLYSSHDNEISKAVRLWALENGNNPLLRIALCGYEGEHDMPSDDWTCVHWKSHGGYGSQRGDQSYENSKRERIWFSRHCLIKQGRLFETAPGSANEQSAEATSAPLEANEG